MVMPGLSTNWPRNHAAYLPGSPGACRTALLGVSTVTCMAGRTETPSTVVRSTVLGKGTKAFSKNEAWVWPPEREMVKYSTGDLGFSNWMPLGIGLHGPQASPRWDR